MQDDSEIDEAKAALLPFAGMMNFFHLNEITNNFSIVKSGLRRIKPSNLVVQICYFFSRRLIAALAIVFAV
jgi:hypothetical protein